MATHNRHNSLFELTGKQASPYEQNITRAISKRIQEKQAKGRDFYKNSTLQVHKSLKRVQNK